MPSRCRFRARHRLELGAGNCGLRARSVWSLPGPSIRKKLKPQCQRDSIRNPQFLFHDLSATAQKLYKLPFGNYAYYFLWQYTAANLALPRAHASEGFDQVQHITWGNFRLPSFMVSLVFHLFLGPWPVAKNSQTPSSWSWSPGSRLGFPTPGVEFFSFLTRLPLMGATFEHATEIVATTNETLRAIPARYREKTRVQQAIGIDPRSFCERTNNSLRHPIVSRKSAKLNLLFVGRLLPWKGIHIGLKAIATVWGHPKPRIFTSPS